MAPSRRMLPPLSMVFSQIAQTRAAYSSGRPRREGNGTLLASAQQLLDDMVTSPMTPQAMEDAFTQSKKALIERALGAELGRKRH